MTNRILVTGADGFIGSHLTESLVKAGHAVTALVQYNSFDSWGWLDKLPIETKKSINVISGDVRDINCVLDASQSSEVIMHLAALIAIPYSYKSPAQYVETNITGTLNVLQAALKNDCKVVQTSTSEVYGSAQTVPITENHPLVGQSPYSATKIAADQLAYSFYASFGLPVTILRPFNTYGPRQSNRAVIPTIISQIAAGNNTIKLGNLNATRDFNFVTDTVEGFKAFLTSEASYGETINLGSGFEIEIGELAELIAEECGIELEIEIDTDRMRPDNSEVDRLLACNKKAKKLLNWEPQYAGLPGIKSGIKQTITWFTNQDNLRHYKTDQYTI